MEVLPDGLPDRLRQWGEVTIRARLSGGHRNDVFSADLRGQDVVVRQTSRPAMTLEWELDLLEHLATEDVGVPLLVPTHDGRRHVDGVTLLGYVPGEPPGSPGDWALVAGTLLTLHSTTTAWAQRPGFASSQHLLTHQRGGDVRLDLMPTDVVEQVRRAWSAVQHGEATVVHGDPGPANIRIHGGRAVLLDWDEARVDVPWFDLADLPTDLRLPDGLDPRDVETAGIAWEAATCWITEPEYARRRADELAQRM
jgi:Ser/Thr protein kinase RdoA (MazF antagonist)